MREAVVLLIMAMSTWVVMLNLAPVAWATTWDLTDNDYFAYTTFLSELRYEARSTQYKFDVPLLPVSPKPSEAYVFAKLIIDKEEKTGGKIEESIITLAMQTKNLYVVAYSDNLSNRAYFFPDSDSQSAKAAIFTEIKKDDKVDIHYESSYQDLEINSGVNDRLNAQLGKDVLRGYARKIIGKEISAGQSQKDQAWFLLVAIQMVAEAARFKYIEKHVTETFEKGPLKPDYKVIDLENKWGKISKSVINAIPDPKDRNDGDLCPPVQLAPPSGQPTYTVTKVSVVKKDTGIALLNANPDSASALSFQKWNILALN